MRTYILFQLFMLFSSLLFGASKIGTYQHVWAINGLNIRSAPNAKAAKIGAFKFGDSLLIEATTTFTYREQFAPKPPGKKNAIYIESQWVKVNYKGQIGYIIDGYLLPIPCPNKKENSASYMQRMQRRFSVDTIESTSFICFSPSIKISFQPKESIEAHELNRIIKGLNLQEVLIFFNPFFLKKKSSLRGYFVPATTSFIINDKDWTNFAEFSLTEKQPKYVLLSLFFGC